MTGFKKVVFCVGLLLDRSKNLIVNGLIESSWDNRVILYEEGLSQPAAEVVALDSTSPGHPEPHLSCENPSSTEYTFQQAAPTKVLLTSTTVGHSHLTRNNLGSLKTVAPPLASSDRLLAIGNRSPAKKEHVRKFDLNRLSEEQEDWLEPTQSAFKKTSDSSRHSNSEASNLSHQLVQHKGGTVSTLKVLGSVFELAVNHKNKILLSSVLNEFSPTLSHFAILLARGVRSELARLPSRYDEIFIRVVSCFSYNILVKKITKAQWDPIQRILIEFLSRFYFPSPDMNPTLGLTHRTEFFNGVIWISEVLYQAIDPPFFEKLVTELKTISKPKPSGAGRKKGKGSKLCCSQLIKFLALQQSWDRNRRFVGKSRALKWLWGAWLSDCYNGYFRTQKPPNPDIAIANLGNWISLGHILEKSAETLHKRVQLKPTHLEYWVIFDILNMLSVEKGTGKGKSTEYCKPPSSQKNLGQYMENLGIFQDSLPPQWNKYQKYNQKLQELGSPQEFLDDYFKNTPRGIPMKGPRGTEFCFYWRFKIEKFYNILHSEQGVDITLDVQKNEHVEQLEVIERFEDNSINVCNKKLRIS